MSTPSNRFRELGIRLARRLQRQAGATAAEYALLISLIAVAIIAGASVLGDGINSGLGGGGNLISSNYDKNWQENVGP
ncbi:MAG: Flp family type IVb pilin [Acidimicrobiia bacterium]|nr:Flp family type IVb pilin [Acidimicrobiia bacterium]